MEFFTECGGIYSNSNGTLISPQHPNSYPELAECVYLISDLDGTYFAITFLFMDIDCQGNMTDFIELKDGKYEDSPLMGRYCGNGTRNPQTITSTQNHLRIR